MGPGGAYGPPPGGAPGPAAGAGAAPMNPGAPRAGRLGLGLGLNPLQRGRFLQAAQAGTAQDYLASRPQLQQRIENRIPGNDEARNAALQNFMATGATPTGATLRYGRQPAQAGGLETAAGAAGGALGGLSGDEAARQADLARVNAGRAAAGAGAVGALPPGMRPLPGRGPAGPPGGPIRTFGGPGAGAGLRGHARRVARQMR